MIKWLLSRRSKKRIQSEPRNYTFDTDANETQRLAINKLYKSINKIHLELLSCLDDEKTEKIVVECIKDAPNYIYSCDEIISKQESSGEYIVVYKTVIRKRLSNNKYLDATALQRLAGITIHCNDHQNTLDTLNDIRKYINKQESVSTVCHNYRPATSVYYNDKPVSKLYDNGKTYCLDDVNTCKMYRISDGSTVASFKDIKDVHDYLSHRETGIIAFDCFSNQYYIKGQDGGVRILT